MHDFTPYVDTITVQFNHLFRLQDKVKITPYSESASETTNHNVSIMPALIKPRVLDESVFLLAAEPSTTTEQDTVSYLCFIINDMLM